MKIKMKEKGQSLLEALVALGAATLVMSAIAVAVLTSVNNSDFGKYLNQATQYSQQGIEVLKQKSISDWVTFSGYTSGATYCFPQDPLQFIPPAGANCVPNIGTNNFFVRSAVLTKNSGNCAGAIKGTLVSVSTAWTDGKCKNASSIYCHTATFNTCITDVDRVPAP